jgi:hypothetical protein
MSSTHLSHLSFAFRTETRSIFVVVELCFVFDFDLTKTTHQVFDDVNGEHSTVDLLFTPTIPHW